MFVRLLSNSVRPVLRNSTPGSFACRTLAKKPPQDETIFDKIVRKEAPADIVYEDETCMAFRDINPVAPVHVVFIPKEKHGLSQLRFVGTDPRHKDLLWHMLQKIPAVVEAAGLEDGYRVVINDGARAGQTVFHLHLHLIGGRELGWTVG
eukprot:Rmarinus@m.26731